MPPAPTRWPLHPARFGTKSSISETEGLRNAFLHITSAEDVARGKPDPQPFLLALKALQQREAWTDSGLVPGDRGFAPGVRGAIAAGMKVLAVANTHTVQDLQEAHAITHSLGGDQFDRTAEAPMGRRHEGTPT